MFQSCVCLSLFLIRQKVLRWLEFSCSSQRELCGDGSQSGFLLCPRIRVVSVPFTKALPWLLRPPGPLVSLCLSDWLLLQASRWVYEEGDPIVLRCHSWKNTHVHKVQYFKDGRGRKFSYQNSEFHIPKARQEDSGSYFCRALIGPSRNESSEAMNVIVKGERWTALEGSEPPVCGVCLPTGKIRWEEISDCATDFFTWGSERCHHSAMWQQEQKSHFLSHKYVCSYLSHWNHTNTVMCPYSAGLSLPALLSSPSLES